VLIEENNMTLQQAVHEYLTRPDKTVPEIVKDAGVGTQTLYDELHRRARRASQGAGATFRRDWITVVDRAIADYYRMGTPVREIKAALNVGASRIYRVIRLLGLEQRR
jgi:transposase